MGEGPIRVRHLVKGLGPGGAERLIVTQVTTPPADDARPVGYDVAYLLGPKNHLVPELERAGVPTHCLGTRRLAHPGWMVRLRSLCRSDPVDIVHVHSPLVAAVARVVIRTMPRRHRPLVVGTEHNRWPRHRMPTRFLNRVTIRWQDATIAVSADVRATMGPGARARTEVIEHGIHLDRVRADADRAGVRREIGVGDDEVLVVCVANLRREKALEILVAAAERAVSLEPSLYYAVVGQGPLAEELADLIAASPAGGRISLLGYRNDATRVVSGADLFTLSSRHEGLPVAVMEALALAIPVASTDAGGVADAVAEAGIIVPVDDIRSLAEAHVTLARDPELRTVLSRTARQRSERFSAARATAAVEAIYDRALAARSSDRAPSSQS